MNKTILQSFLLVLVILLQCFIVYENYTNKKYFETMKNEIVDEILKNNLDRLDKNRLQRIYDIISPDYYSESFEEFVLHYGTSRVEQKRLYDFLKKDYYSGTFEKFTKQYF
tara:strand:- start:1530 stop:1862 length:333 start_codon:yes stop_codon:yes gene_type:complete